MNLVDHVSLLVLLRMLLENLGTMVLPNQKAIAKVNTLMEDGAITDEKTIKQLKNLGKETAELAGKLA